MLPFCAADGRRWWRGGVVDRGRRSIALEQPGAVDVVLRLLDGADALIEGFRPGGLGPVAWRAIAGWSMAA